jgi:hypothetical protein
MRWVIAVAVIAALAVLALMLWPTSRVELAPEPTRQAEPIPGEGSPHFHGSEPAGPAAAALPREPAPLGNPQAAAVRPTPGPQAEPAGSARAEKAVAGPLPPGAGSFAPDGGPRFGITRDGIRAAVQAGIPEIKDCYEQWLRLQPTLGGKLKVTFTIDTEDGVEGKVSKVSLGDAGIGHAMMEGCILQVFEDLRFEPPLGGKVDVSYPIVLANTAADGG